MTPSPQPSPYRERGRNPLLKEARRQLRQNQTDAERALWKILRSRQLQRYKFRRQHPIGTYIADFCCLEARLVIEVDGGHHANQVDNDQNRTEVFEELGFRVKRFWNNEVLAESEAVIKTILDVLGSVTDLPERQSPYHWRR